MIVEYRDNTTTVTNNDVEHKIADAEYYLAIAMINGNRKRKRYWLKKIEQLRQELENKKD